MNIIQAYYSQRYEGTKFNFSNDRILNFEYADKTPRKIKTLCDHVNLLFSYLLKEKASQYIGSAPEYIFVCPLENVSKYTGGTYVAETNNNDRNIKLRLNYKKIVNPNDQPFQTFSLTWVLFHEFRHMIQNESDLIKSVINYPNWENFNKYMQEASGKSEDEINHVFHELNPAEVDANIFACEMTGLKFQGNVFNITRESLSEFGIHLIKL